MHLCILIIGLVLFPQAYTLKCNKCRTTNATCVNQTEERCPADSTHCVTMRQFIYAGYTKKLDRMERFCSKAEHCKDGSFNTGVMQHFIMTKCCATDKCNTKNPSNPDLRPNPNGRKCYSCDGKGNCNGTLNCDGDQTYCATGLDEYGTVKGCATKSMCVDPSPQAMVLKCCEGNLCNGSTSTSVSLLLLSIMLFSFFF